MLRQFTVTGAVLALTLFAAPTWSLTDNPPPRVDQEDQAIETARDGAVKKAKTLAISRKELPSPEAAESVDCFYEYNRALAECSAGKTSGH